MSATSAGEALAPVRLHAPIPRTPALAAGISGLIVLSLATFGLGPRGFIAAFGACALAVLAAVDIEHRLLPNRILLPATAIVLTAQVAFFPDRAVEWLLAGVAAALFLAVPLIANRDAMGMGDIKLALLLGALVGWNVFYAIALGCLAMLPVALVLLRRAGSLKGATLPFGPFLALGTILVLFAT